MACILIIDDDEYIRELLSPCLEAEGPQVLVAPNGEVGVAIFRDRLPHLVITDMCMPVQDGLETITELLRDFPGTKIVAISGADATGKKGEKNLLLVHPSAII